MRVTAIIAAGGHGARFGGGIPKQLLDLGGRTILQRAVDAFDLHPRVDRIIVALPLPWTSEWGKYVHRGLKPLLIVTGGDDRQASVANAFDGVDTSELARSDDDVVLVHDAARPLVSAALIDRMIDAAAVDGARGLLAADDQRHLRGLRIGTGYDLHRLVKNRPLVLGGVTIPFPLGLAGHSDADALCHAMIDAILGAAAAGDIGRHFPDTDE